MPMKTPVPMSRDDFEALKNTGRAESELMRSLKQDEAMTFPCTWVHREKNGFCSGRSYFAKVAERFGWNVSIHHGDGTISVLRLKDDETL